MYIVGCLPALLAYLVQCRYLTNRWVTLVGEFFFSSASPFIGGMAGLRRVVHGTHLEMDVVPTYVKYQSTQVPKPL